MDEKEKLYGGDEIYEAIRREDFLRTVRNLIPLFILAAILILASTLGYVWWNYHHENKLYDAESAYISLLEDVKADKFVEAKHKARMGILKKNPGFSILASLQLAHAFQIDIQNARSDLSWEQLKDTYRALLEKRPSVSLDCFFAAATGFLDPQSMDKRVSEHIQKFFFSGHSWYDAGLILEALKAYVSKDQQRIRKAFGEWEAEASSVVKWLPAYCNIGQGFARPLPSSTSSDSSSQPVEKNKSK